LREDVRTVREAFSAAVGRRARWRARLLPPSTLTSVRATIRLTGARLGAAAEHLERFATRLKRR
jgi:hypothetical protein